MKPAYFEVLSAEEIERIDAASMDILGSVGLRVDLQRARDTFREGGAQVDEATRSVRIPEEVVRSALANLEQAQPGVDVDRVFISKITVDGGPSLRRGRPASKWVRMHRILKRMSHITVELAVKE